MRLKLALLTAVGIAGLMMGVASAADTTLTFLTFETPNLTPDYWDKAITATSAVVPGVTIKKLVAPNADRNAYARQLDSTGQLPDIMVAVSPAGLAEAGKLAEFSKEELSDWVNPTANSYAGKIYQLPTNTQTIPMVYYNLADFQKAGIASPPKTWADFLADCQKLKDAGITPINIGGGGADTWADLYVLKALVASDVYAKDPDWLSKLVAGKTTFHDPLFVGAVTKFKTLIDKGYVDAALLSNDYGASQAAFLANKAAMYAMGSWFTVAPTADQQKDYGVFPWPTDDGKLVVSAFTGGGLSVSSKAPDVDKAKQWAIAFSKLKSNADGGVHFDALFIALKDYAAPTDVTPLYKATLDLYNEALKTGTVTNTFTEEQGIPSVPAGFSAEVAADIGDLINGRKDVDAFVGYLDDKMKELKQ
jgi:ABC-type glycerol-3-phosphate transport system substrate-binding protein